MGFSVSVFVVAVIGTDQAWYWLILPFVVFGAAYCANILGFMAGQAAFTLFAVVLFCILLPQARHTSIRRLADIAMGGAVSLVVSSLLRLGRGAPRTPTCGSADVRNGRRQALQLAGSAAHLR